MKKQTIFIATVALIIAALVAAPVLIGIMDKSYTMTDLERIQDDFSPADYYGVIGTHIDQTQMKLVVTINNRNPIAYWSAVRLFFAYGSAVDFVFGDISNTLT